MYKNTLFLFDLDHTLYDAETPWQELVNHLLVKDFGWKNFPWHVYRTIRDYHSVFDLFFEKSFRHNWLSKELIVLLLSIRNNTLSANDLFNDLDKFQIRLKLIKSKQYRPSFIRQEALEFVKTCEVLNNALQIIGEKKDNMEVIQIENKFQSGANINCYEGVFELLNLIEGKNAKFYLVSEGEYELQVWKTKLLDIYKFFKNKILITESYKHAPIYLKNLNIIKKNTFDGGDRPDKRLKEIEQADDVVRKYELLKFKEDLFFYYAVLRCIMLDANNPEGIFISTAIDELLELNNIIDNKVVIIGDRIDKDILPIWEIKANNSELFRIRSGKYRTRDAPKKILNSNYKEFRSFSSLYKYFSDM